MTTENEIKRGWLRHGNTPGDPSTAPRCGARTRRGTPCQCSAIRGRRRCRLHGGRSTGPRTAEGLARIRAANTRHGRYSREQLRINRYIQNGIRSTRLLPDERARVHFRQRAESPEILELTRQEVREELAAEERERLEALKAV